MNKLNFIFLGLIGNPLPQEIMGPYVESGTLKLLEVFLESLPGNLIKL